ncbi:MAG: SurA N-terminal domain-containing protein, partial [Methylococcaceae bacterium]
SEPVRTSFGYHLIKVINIDAKQVQPFEAVKAELINNHQRNAAENAFYEQGQKLTQLGFEHPDSLDQAARILKLKIQETQAFTRESGKGVAEHEEIRKAAFSEEVLNGRNSEPVELDNELAVVLRIKTHEPARNQSLNDAREAITNRMHAEETGRQTLQRTLNLITEIKAGKSMLELSKAQKGLTYKKIPAIKRDSAEYPPELVDAIFTTPVGIDGKAVARNVELEDGSQGIFQIISQKTGLSTEDMAKQEDSAHTLLTQSEGQRELAAWIAQLRQTFDIHIKGLPKTQQNN